MGVGASDQWPIPNILNLNARCSIWGLKARTHARMYVQRNGLNWMTHDELTIILAFSGHASMANIIRWLPCKRAYHMAYEMRTKQIRTDALTQIGKRARHGLTIIYAHNSTRPDYKHHPFNSHSPEVPIDSQPNTNICLLYRLLQRSGVANGLTANFKGPTMFILFLMALSNNIIVSRTK